MNSTSIPIPILYQLHIYLEVMLNAISLIYGGVWVKQGGPFGLMSQEALCSTWPSPNYICWGIVKSKTLWVLLTSFFFLPRWDDVIISVFWKLVNSWLCEGWTGISQVDQEGSWHISLGSDENFITVTVRNYLEIEWSGPNEFSFKPLLV